MGKFYHSFVVIALSRSADQFAEFFAPGPVVAEMDYARCFLVIVSVTTLAFVAATLDEFLGRGDQLCANSAV